MEKWTQFPEEMIQHIQSFLTRKEAVRTIILSKFWYNAWLTRPNLDFDDHDFVTPSAFVEFVNKTLQRYDELNLKIRRFKLSGFYWYACISDGISVATEWTKKAMKLGATDLDIDISSEFVLPREVLQSDSLVRLSLVRGGINLHKVNCWRLKYLSLCQVRVEDNNYNIWDISWKCPLIEELLLSTLCNSSCDYLVLKPKLVANDFPKLKVLSFDHVVIDECLFRDLSSKFPCLEDLTIQNCTGYEKIQICSDSLKRVVLLDDDNSKMLRVEFDVPRICRFEFLSFFVPSLSFKTTSMGWESHIDIISTTVNSSWFVEFRKFLLELSSSKIYLKLLIFPDNAYECASHISGLPKPPIVEFSLLQLDAWSSVSSILLEEFFWSCRPNFIRLPLYGKKYDIIKLICNTLIKEECGMHDLEEVNVEISGHIAWTWSRNLITNTPPRASKFANSEWIGTHTDVCIQLKWG